MIGLKIKELRLKNKMTQKDLGEKLYVTSQAVSRWESGEVEPSIATIIEISKIFNVTTDELLNIVSDNDIKVDEQVDSSKVQTQTKQKVVRKPILCCDHCKRLIREPSDIIELKDSKICKKCYIDKFGELPVVEEKEEVKPTIQEVYVYDGKRRKIICCDHCKRLIHNPDDIIENEKGKICRSCYDEKNGIKKNTTTNTSSKTIGNNKYFSERIQDLKYIRESKIRRINSFIFGPLAAIVPIILAIQSFLNDYPLDTKLFWIYISYTTIAFVSILIFNNTFYNKMFLDILKWGFYTVPKCIGKEIKKNVFLFIIFTGIFLTPIVVCMTLASAGVLICFLFAFIIAPFIYPTALIRNIKDPYL